MNLLKKLTKKNLELNRKRTIVTIIGILLSVALITAVATMFVSLYKSIIVYEESLKGNFHISFNEVPNEDLKYFKENRYIDSYHLVERIGYAKLEGSKNESKPYLYIEGFTKDSLENMAVNLIEGRLPENDHELLIPHHIKTNGRVEYHIGETITLNIGKRMMDGQELSQHNPYGEPFKETESDKIIQEEIVDTKEYTYTIVGIIERPSNYVEEFTAPGYTCITLNDNPTGKTDVYVKLNKKGLKEPEKVIAGILNVDEKAFKKYYYGDVSSEDEELEYLKELEKAKYDIGYYNQYLVLLEGGIFKDPSFIRLGYVAGVVCLIIIITSVFCIKNSFDISIAEKTKQYGMLSSIGATKKQIKKNVYYEAFKLGVVGIPLGIILGIIASEILVIICNFLLHEMLNVKIICSISIMAIIFGVLLGVVTIYLSSLRSANRASKISPISAIRNSADIKIKSKKIKSPKIIKKIFGVGGDISYKNLKRSKKKYRTTVISIIVCVAVFIALSSFMNTFYQYITIEYAAKDYNIAINIKTDDYESIHEKIATFTSRDDVKDYGLEETDTGSIKNAKKTKDKERIINQDEHYVNWYDSTKTPEEYRYGEINIARIGDYQYRKYLKELNLNYDDVKDKLILLNQVESYDFKNNQLFKYYAFEYKKGDKITIGILTSDEEGYDIVTKEREYEIALVTTNRPFGFESLSSNAIFIVSDEMYEKYSSNEKYYENYFFDVEDPDKFQDDLEKAFKEEEVSISNIAEEKRMMNSLHLLIAIFLYGFITVIALIGITNIFNTITTNMELRKREFATLKSIGMTTKEFNRMISLESFFYGTKSLLIGIPIGIILSLLLDKLLNGEMKLTAWQVPYTSIILSIIVVFLLITIIMKFSINKINKQNTIETIRNENI